MQSFALSDVDKMEWRLALTRSSLKVRWHQRSIPITNSKPTRSVRSESVAMINILHHFKNGEVDKAERAWYGLKDEERQSTKLWNLMMNEFIKKGHFNKSLISMEQMQQNGIRCDHETYCHALRACIGLKSLEKGMEIHAQILKEGLKVNVNWNQNRNGYRHDDRVRNLQRSLIGMYDALWSNAQKTCSQYKAVMDLVLNNQRQREHNRIPTTLSVLGLFNDAESEDVVDEEIAVYALMDCGDRRALDDTKRIHRVLMAMNRKLSTKTLNVLIASYSKCRAYEIGWRVFESIDSQQRDFRSYLNAIILCGHWGPKGMERGKQLHRELTQKDRGYLSSMNLRCALLTLYGKGGDIRSAERVWTESNAITNGTETVSMSVSDRLSMATVLMRSYCINDEDAKALDLYHEITRKEAVAAEHVIHCIALRALGNLGDFDRGQRPFELIRRHCDDGNTVKKGDNDRIRMRSALIAFAMKCGMNLDGASFVDMDSYRGAIVMVTKEIETEDVLGGVDGVDENRNMNRNENRIRNRNEGVLRRMRAEFKLLFGTEFTAKDWLTVLDAAGHLGDIRAMMAEWECLMASGQTMTTRLLVAVLQHLVRCGEAQFVGDIWNDVMLSINRESPSDGNAFTLCSLSLQSLILCVDRSRYYHRSSLLLEIWNLAVHQHGVRPNVHCHCLTILAFSKSSEQRDRQMAERLLLNLENNDEMKQWMATNPLSLIQVLTSYGNIDSLDKMWAFYGEWTLKQNASRHDIIALMVMSSKETRTDKLNDILDAVDQHIESDWNSSRRITVDQLIGFHRVAIRVGNESIVNTISNALRIRHQLDDRQNVNVISTVQLNGRSMAMDTGYERAGDRHYDHSANDKVDALMAEIGYVVDTSICPELPTESARRKHLKSHSEKKALAVLLHQKEAESKKGKDINDSTLTVRVGMRMCADCHRFFCAVSRQYTRYNIRCIDPKGIHLFKNGVCYLCD